MVLWSGKTIFCGGLNFYFPIFSSANKSITQITMVLALSSTIRVVALSSLVTLMPAKLKNAILNIFPENNMNE